MDLKLSLHKNLDVLTANMRQAGENVQHWKWTDDQLFNTIAGLDITITFLRGMGESGGFMKYLLMQRASLMGYVHARGLKY